MKLWWVNISSPQMAALILLSFMGVLCPSLVGVLLSGSCVLLDWEVFSFCSMIMNFPVILDKYSLLFSLTVVLISMSVMLFSVSYMSGDPNLSYFIFMVMLFVASMNLLVFIPHLIILLLGWDGLGITSYLLVIYYQNDSSLSAGMVTAMTNRIGDALLILAGAWAFISSQWLHGFVGFGLMGSVIVVVMVGSMTKSAQIPFSAWLPAAMAAPTPVSSLVHSSTLVTAGVYLLVRFYSTLSEFWFFNSYVFFAGLVTSMMAGMVANYEFDLKKVIALSTLSQLGVMMLSLGMGQPMLTFFHLITHALFKALLFICAGTIIHSSQNNQDLRMMGNIWDSMPVTCSSLNIANLALCGIPFMAGFYSKDLIIEVLFLSSMPFVSLFLFIVSVCITSAYSVRLSLLTLWSSYKLYPISIKNDESFYTYIPCFILSFGAVLGGAFIFWFMVPSLYAIVLPMVFKFFALTAILVYGLLSVQFVVSNKVLPSLHFMSSMWFLGFVSFGPVSDYSMKLGNSFNDMEQSWMEVFSGRGLMGLVGELSRSVSLSQNSSLSAIMSVLSVLVFMFFILLCHWGVITLTFLVKDSLWSRWYSK